MRLAFAAVATIALACLLLRAGRVGMAGDYLDPVSRIGAQDESLYAHSAIQMARHGDWLTPKFMGRFGLYKPPLLAAAAGFSARIFGISRLALRLPVALFAAFAVGLVFWWGAELRSWQAGVCSAALLISNHLWHTLATMCLTDAILTAFYVAAMFCLFADPWLESKAAFWGYAVSVAGGILTKGVAGVLPLGILGLYWLLAPRRHRPTFRRVVFAGSLAVTLAAPWFLYQMAVHGRWFWAEHVQVELLGYGAGAPPQTSQESHLVFYLSRLALLDPVLLAVSVVAFLSVVQLLRRRSGADVLLLLWLAVPLAAAFFWQYRNATYLLPAIPAMAILAGSYNPLSTGSGAKWMMLLLAVAFVVKAATPDAPWGLSFAAGTRVEATEAISSYCERDRGNQLVLVDIPDELYASLLPLPGARYVLRGEVPPASPYGLDFPALGIILSAQQFAEIESLLPAFRRHLQEWGLDTAEAVGTVVFASSDDDVMRIVRAHPESDFLLAERYREVLAGPGIDTHDVVAEPPNSLLLLSRQQLPPPAVRWSCRL